MNPVLAVGYIFNLLLLNGVFGLVGVILVLGASAGAYFLFSKNAGDNKKYLAQVLALSIGYVAGVIGVFNADWSNGSLNFAALLLEPLVFFIFLSLGKR